MGGGVVKCVGDYIWHSVQPHLEDELDRNRVLGRVHIHEFGPRLWPVPGQHGERIKDRPPDHHWQHHRARPRHCWKDDGVAPVGREVTNMIREGEFVVHYLNAVQA